MPLNQQMIANFYADLMEEVDNNVVAAIQLLNDAAVEHGGNAQLIADNLVEQIKVNNNEIAEDKEPEVKFDIEQLNDPPEPVVYVQGDQFAVNWVPADPYAHDAPPGIKVDKIKPADGWLDLGVPKQQKIKPANKIKVKNKRPYIGGDYYHTDDEEAFDPPVSKPQTGVGYRLTMRGLMVFYIDTGNIATGAALDLMDKVKEQHRQLEQILKTNKIEVMWLPRTNGETKVDYFSFM